MLAAAPDTGLDQFQGHDPVQALLQRFEHHSHRAVAKLLQDFVTGDVRQQLLFGSEDGDSRFQLLITVREFGEAFLILAAVNGVA